MQVMDTQYISACFCLMVFWVELFEIMYISFGLFGVVWEV